MIGVATIKKYTNSEIVDFLLEKEVEVVFHGQSCIDDRINTFAPST